MNLINAGNEARLAVETRQRQLTPEQVHDQVNQMAQDETDRDKRPAKLKAKRNLRATFNLPQLDGGITSEFSDSSPDQSVNIEVIKRILSPTGLDPLNEDEPFNFFETTFSCPDLLQINSFDVFVVGPRSRGDSISESDLPSSLQRRLRSQTDPNFLDI